MELEAKNLSWGIGHKKILKKILLHIKKKEIVGLIGPNGSGKSSLLRMLYRYNNPNNGEIFIGKREITTMTRQEIAQNIGVVLQEREGLNNRRVFDIVLMGRSPHKYLFDKEDEQDFKITLNALKKVNLERKMSRTFGTLSGGEKQRVLIAIAIAQRTKILMLDEPTNHLDPQYQLQVMDLIKSLRTTTIVAMHDLNLASRYCDRLILLKNGQIFAEGYSQEVLTKENISKVYNITVDIRYNKKTEALDIIYLNRTK